MFGCCVSFVDGSGMVVIEDVVIELNCLGEWVISQFFLCCLKMSVFLFVKGLMMFVVWSEVVEECVLGELQLVEQFVVFYFELYVVDFVNILFDLLQQCMIEVVEELFDD